jgi:drug/metabolite transporter (DMT)-like permease
MTSGWLLVAGVVLPLLGLWVSTWEGNYHSGSVWEFINQAESRGEPWSAAAIQSNQDFLIAAALLILAGLTCLVVGLVVAIRTLRRRNQALS